MTQTISESFIEIIKSVGVDNCKFVFFFFILLGTFKSMTSCIWLNKLVYFQKKKKLQY